MYNTYTLTLLPLKKQPEDVVMWLNSYLCGRGHVAAFFAACCPTITQHKQHPYRVLLPPANPLQITLSHFCHSKKQPEDVVMVSVMPCTAKKHEANRPEVRQGLVMHVQGLAAVHVQPAVCVVGQV